MSKINGVALGTVINPSGAVNSNVLAASVAETVTVPDNMSYVLFSATSNFWADFTGTTAVVPIDVTDGTAPELNPVGRRVTAGKTISIISDVAAIVGTAFYEE